MHNATNALIILAIITWLLQILLGGWQVSRFNKAFTLLCKQGNVGIGRTKGRFKARLVIAIAFDEDRRVVNSFIVKGYTVFSKPQPILSLQGLHHNEIDPAIIFPKDKMLQAALSEAIRIN